MKTKNFFLFLDEELMIGITLPIEIVNQRMSEFLDIDDIIKKEVPKHRIQDLIEGQAAIINMLTDDFDTYKSGILPAERYVQLLEKEVFTAIHAAIYFYTEGDGDREKFIQRTQALFTFVLGYITAYAGTDQEIGDKILRGEIFVIFEILEASHIDIDWSNEFFITSDLCINYVNTWYIE